eukprot:GEMP01029248.1.p1 GENE.GEMP01029248.1~~GEMP01029248.1.p1  ORF type:complete len:602 (+),score=124.76 GEMP01029248.1:30-1808(+)
MEVDFIWLLEHLVAAGPVHLHIPETAVISNGEVSALYYTDKNGDLRKKCAISAPQLWSRFRDLRRRRGATNSPIRRLEPCGTRVPVVTQDGKSPWKNLDGAIQCPVGDGEVLYYDYQDCPPDDSPKPLDRAERFPNFIDTDSRVMTSAVPLLFDQHLAKSRMEILAGRFWFLKIAERKLWLLHVTKLTVRMEISGERKTFKRYFSEEALQRKVENLRRPVREKEVSRESRDKAARFADMLNLMSDYFAVVKKDSGIECFHERGEHCGAEDTCLLHRQFVDRVNNIPVLQGTNVTKIVREFGAKKHKHPNTARRPLSSAATALRPKPPLINFTIIKRPRSSAAPSRPHTAQLCPSRPHTRLWTPPWQERDDASTPAQQLLDCIPPDTARPSTAPAISIQNTSALPGGAAEKTNTTGSAHHFPDSSPQPPRRPSAMFAIDPGASKPRSSQTSKLGVPATGCASVRSSVRVSVLRTPTEEDDRSRRMSALSIASQGSRKRDASPQADTKGRRSKVKSGISFAKATSELLERAGPVWGPLGCFPALSFDSTKKVKERRGHALRIVMVPEKNPHTMKPTRHIARRVSEPRILTQIMS